MKQRQYFEFEGRHVEFSPTQTILDSVLEAGLSLDSSCGGSGSCGTCLVRVDVGLGFLGERNELESEMALARSYAPNERLGCQTLAVAGCKVSVGSVKS